jgi:hypothetical protein
LANELAEPVDGPLVGAKILAVQRRLGLAERRGLLGEDPGELVFGLHEPGR